MAIDPFVNGLKIDPNTEEDTLKQALEIFRGVAKQAFTDAYNDALAPKPTNDPNDPAGSARALAAWEAGVAKAKGQLASALQQLVQTDVMLSEALGRQSYRSLVDLILNTKTALEGLVKNTVGVPADLHARSELIAADAALLQALANIAPLVLWQKGGAAG
jgi:hypothetical protein